MHVTLTAAAVAKGGKCTKTHDPLVDGSSLAGAGRLGLALSAMALSVALGAMPVQAGLFSKHKTPPSSFDTLRLSGINYCLTDSADGKRYESSDFNSNGRAHAKWEIDKKMLSVPFQSLHDTAFPLAIAALDMRQYVPTKKYDDVADYHDITYYLEKLYPQGHSGLKIIYFWATYCSPCVHSMPLLPEYQRTLNAFKDSCEKKFNMKLPEIRICPLCTDGLGSNAEGLHNAREFAGEHLAKYPLPYLAAGGWTKAFDTLLYPVKGDRPLPSFILVDENNVIRKVQHPDYWNYKTVPDFIATEILYPYFEHLHKDAGKK